MDTATRQLLETAGIDVDEALDRFVGNEALMLKFMARFPADQNYPQLKRALAGGDGGAAFTAAHTLKGVVGNLSMKELFQQVGALVEDLRVGDLEAAAGKMPALEQAYSQVTGALAKLA